MAVVETDFKVHLVPSPAVARITWARASPLSQELLPNILYLPSGSNSPGPATPGPWLKSNCSSLGERDTGKGSNSPWSLVFSRLKSSPRVSPQKCSSPQNTFIAFSGLAACPVLRTHSWVQVTMPPVERFNTEVNLVGWNTVSSLQLNPLTSNSSTVHPKLVFNLTAESRTCPYPLTSPGHFLNL